MDVKEEFREAQPNSSGVALWYCEWRWERTGEGFEVSLSWEHELGVGQGRSESV